MKSLTVTQYKELWKKVLDLISKEMDKKIFDAFFSMTTIKEVRENQIYVLCPSYLVRDILNDKYKEYIKSKIYDVTSSDYELILLSPEDVSSLKADHFEQVNTEPEFFKNSIIDPNFTFDNFVVGPSNREAQIASLSVATCPGSMYQTLFIYGGSGLGKTHLLYAIGNYIKETLPDKKVLYCSSSDFFSEYVDFLNSDNKKEQLFTFLKKFDVLMIDDIQMLSNRKRTQEFFFSVYEDFRQNHKQLCVTSDKLPGDLIGIDSRIVTRFTSGLSVPITKPNSETCKEILIKKIEATDLDINRYDKEVINFMAEHFKDSIRSLEGALVRLNFYASMNKTQKIDLNFALEALQGLVNCESVKNSITENKILDVVAAYYSLSVKQITGKLKPSNIALARHVAIYLIRDMLDLPLKKIGALFSNRDHSTILHSIEKVEKMLKDDKQTKIAIDEIKKRISS